MKFFYLIPCLLFPVNENFLCSLHFPGTAGSMQGCDGRTLNTERAAKSKALRWRRKQHSDWELKVIPSHWAVCSLGSWRERWSGKGRPASNRRNCADMFGFSTFHEWSGVVLFCFVFHRFTHSCKDEKLQSLSFFFFNLPEIFWKVNALRIISL